MKKFTLILFSIYLSLSVKSQDTLSIYSHAMDKTLQNIVILPSNAKGPFPVVYLLHGYGGDFSNWLNRVPKIIDLAEKYGMVIVCPEGSSNSWYINSPKDSTYKYESYIIDELIPTVEQQYLVSSSPKNRFITGLSMGGHGAMYLGINNIELFGGLGSLSGGLDLRPFPTSWNLIDLLGPIEDNPKIWDDHSVVNLLDKLQYKDIPILIDCGVDDFFIHVNRNAHTKLLDLGIQHEYIERPGAHNWEYWSDNIEYHFLFFYNIIN